MTQARLRKSTWSLVENRSNKESWVKDTSFLRHFVGKRTVSVYLETARTARAKYLREVCSSERFKIEFNTLLSTYSIPKTGD